ncbi:hypothetical protein [Cryobacterium sp. M91]|uniref:hypothetical protein n=1 Tax=Cryobacterium sp. M91 TaxID=2048294 RepID=UPI0011B0D411|nr:hypothetical protein [Cryobacterium sp. M91]
MRIAIIVDGLESTRQFHSDDGDVIRQACERIRIGNSPIEVEIFRDAQVDYLLDGLADSDVAALFFASNSLRHADGHVAQAVNRHRSDIVNFLKAGCGLAVLHQYGVTDLPLEMPNGTTVRYFRATPGKITPMDASISDRDSDPLLNYPQHIADLDEGLATTGQLQTKVSWMAVDLSNMEGFEAVVRGATGDILLSRSSDAFDWRVVACAVPLDWHASEGLLRNIAQFITTGSPQCVVWPAVTGTVQSPLAPALSQLGSSYVVNPALHQAAVERTGPTEEWLVNRPALHLVNDIVHPQKISRAWLESAKAGGVVLGAGATSDSDVTFFAGVIGSRRREFAQNFFSNLDSDVNGVRTGTDIFPLRNQILAASYFCGLFPDLRNVWNPRTDPLFTARLSSLVYPDMTMTSVLATVQILTSVSAPTKVLLEVQGLLTSLAPDDAGTHALTSACRTAIERGTMDDFLSTIVKIGDADLDAPLAIRLLDWTGFLSLGLGLSVEQASLHDVVSRLVDHAEPSERDGLWMSIEGTTSVVLGVVAAVKGYPDGIGLLDRITKGLMILRGEYAQNLSDPSKTDIMTRLAHALAIAEQSSPLVIDRIAEAVPRSTYVSGHSDSRGHHDHAARQTEMLSVRNREVNASLVQARQSLAARTPIWVFGAFFVWLLACSSLVWLGVLAGQIYRWPTVAPFLTAPVAFIWFWVAIRLIWALERFEIVPSWLARLSRSFPKFAAKKASPGAARI